MNIVPKARRRVSMRSALLLTLCACLIITAGRIAVLMIPAYIRPLPELALTMLAFGGGAYLGLCVLDGDQKKILPRAALGRAQILYLVLLGVLCICPATLTADLWRSLFAPGVSQQTYAMAAGRDASLFILQLLKSALIAPVCEELFFRGYLLCALRRYGVRRALITASLCFALAHGVNVGGLLVHLLLGCLLGGMMLKTGSLFAPMLVHGCYNLTIVLISYAGLTPVFSRLSPISCALRVFGCAAFIVLYKKVHAAPRSGERVDFSMKMSFGRKEWALVISSLALACLAAVHAGGMK